MTVHDALSAVLPTSPGGIIAAELERVRAAIRNHRDQRGDDRCWLDDLELYSVLPEGPSDPATLALPPRDQFLESCCLYHAQRQPRPDDSPADPTEGSGTIAQSEAEIVRLRNLIGG